MLAYCLSRLAQGRPSVQLKSFFAGNFRTGPELLKSFWLNTVRSREGGEHRLDKWLLFNGLFHVVYI
jgi:hypothetical protein